MRERREGDHRLRARRRRDGRPSAGGEYRLKVTPAGERCRDAILTAKAEIPGGWNRNYTAIANLDDHGTPNLAIWRNNVRKTEEGQARVVVRHMADAPAVNVWANGSPLNRGRQFVWGQARRFDVPGGHYDVFVSLARQSDPVIGPAHLRLMDGYSYQVYAWGNGAAGYGLVVIPVEVGEKHRASPRAERGAGWWPLATTPLPFPQQGSIASTQAIPVGRPTHEHPGTMVRTSH